MPLKLFLMMNLTVLLLFGFLLGLLAAAGYYFDISGYWIVGLAVVIIFAQWFVGPSIIRWTTNMRLVEKGEMAWLQRDVEDLCKKNKTPIPKLAIVRSGQPNAFVFGRTSGSATLAITEGLINNLTKEEVKAVIAHEIGHIKHNDMVIMTLVAAIPVIAYYVARFLVFAPKSNSGKRNGGAAILIGVAAFLVYFVSNLLVLAFSRLREYYSDRFGGENTKPALLASALAKITYGLSMAQEKENVAVRSFFIADPVTAKMEMTKFSSEYADFNLTNKELEGAMEWERSNIFARISEIFATHPLTFKRIAALKEMEKK
jgi:heat shock protein HtpX